MFSEFKIRSVDELVFLIQVLAWSFVVFVLMSVFGGTVGSMLWSVMFNQQPMKSMSPIDMAFTKMLNDVMLLMTGSVTTLITMFAVSKGAKSLAEKIAPSIITPPPTTPPTPLPASAPQTVASSAMPDFNWMGWTNPQLDESWVPPPPPTTPADHLEPDDERHALAHARSEQ